MAYLFNSVSDDDADAGKQNIFGGQQPEQGGAQGGAFEKEAAPAAPSGGGGAQTAPSSAGKASASGGGYNPAAASSAYKSAASTMNLPSKALGRAEGQLSEGSKKLQEQADAYTTGYEKEAQGYGLDKSTLAGAAGGTDADYQKTAQRLNQADTSQNYKAFEGLGENTPNIQNIRDPASLYRAESGPRYTAGQSRFDAAMLRRNPEFIRQQQDLLAREKSLGEQSKKTSEDKTKQAREFLAKQFQDTTGDIRGQLGGLGKEIITAAQQKEAAEDLRRQGIDKGSIAAAEQDKIKAQIKADLATADPRSEQARALKYLGDQYDLGNFASVDRDTDWRQFIGAPEAEKYNRVQGLLGSGDMLTPEKGPGEAGSFDQAGAYRQIMSQMQGKRQQADRLANERLAAIQSGAQARGSETQKQVQADYDALKPQLQTMYNDKNPRSGEITSTGDGNFSWSDPNAMPEFQSQNLDWKSVLTPDEVQEMNALEGDLGVINPGNYQANTANPYADLKKLQNELYGWQQSKNTSPQGIGELPGAQPSIPKVGGGGGGSSKPTAGEKQKLKSAK